MYFIPKIKIKCFLFYNKYESSFMFVSLVCFPKKVNKEIVASLEPKPEDLFETRFHSIRWFRCRLRCKPSYKSRKAIKIIQKYSQVKLINN